jgi:hypothetical protein
MKKLIPIFGILFICSLPFLYGQTITLPGMTETTSISANDLLWVWLDPAGANASRKIKASNLLARNIACEIGFGTPGAADALQDGYDQPASCGNITGADATITAVACYADAGSPTVTPILTGGSATSIVTGAVTCGNGAWAAGTVQSSPVPVLKSFSANGATCSSTPCDLAANITAANSAKYIVVRITLMGR